MYGDNVMKEESEGSINQRKVASVKESVRYELKD